MKNNRKGNNRHMEEMDLKELFNMFWSKKIQIILIILIFGIIGFIYTIEFITPMYDASTTLVLVSSADETVTTNTMITATDVSLNSKLVATYSELIKSKNVLREVISNLNTDLEEDMLKNYITVSAVEDTELIEITVRNEEPSNAAVIANEIAEVFTDKVKEIYNINNVQIVDKAEVSSEPANINHTKDVIMFASIGLVIAIIYVIVANMLDTTIKTAEDVETAYNIPVLVSIPMIKHLGNERK